MSECTVTPPAAPVEEPLEQACEESDLETKTPAKSQSESSTAMIVNNLATVEKEDLSKDIGSPCNLGHFNGFNVSRVKMVKLGGTGKCRHPGPMQVDDGSGGRKD